MMAPCCPHPVERHVYNGCADCGCSLQWNEHPDRDRDTSPAGIEAIAARRVSEIELAQLVLAEVVKTKKGT